MCAPFDAVVVFQLHAYGELASVATTAPSSRNSTLVTPTSSVADAVTLAVPDTVAPFAGVVIDVAGAVVSLSTVTLTVVDDPTFPAASLARDCSVCAPFDAVVVFQLHAYGELASVATTAPSSRNSTLVTPTSSVADAVTLAVPDTVAPFAGVVIDVAGAVVSLSTVTLTVVDDPTFPAASLARDCSVCAPFDAVAVFQLHAYGDVVSVAATAPSSRNSTLVTPTLSVADAVTLVVPDTVAAFAGAVIDVAGASVSPAAAASLCSSMNS